MTARLDTIRTARHGFVDTVEGLTEAEFDHGTTLCSAWAPRDVLAHLIGTAEIERYLRAPWRLHAINAELVAEGARLTVQKLQPTLLRYRVEPTNGSGRPHGRGTVVRGTAEALGLWLGGRTVSDVQIG